MRLDMSTLFLARLIGIYLFVMGLALVTSTDRFKSLFLKIKGDESQLLIGAIVSIIFGAAIVSIHNTWVWGWPVLITIIGYWGIIKGFLLISSNKFINFIEPMLALNSNTYRVLGAVFALIGLFLLYQGFCATY